MADDDQHSGRQPTNIFVQLAEMKRDVRQLQQHDMEARRDIADLREAAMEHSMRLENGVKVFADQKAKLDSIEARTTPKPVSIFKIAATTIGLFCTAAGALWLLSNQLRDRPTLDQVKEVIEYHDDNGHKDVRDSVRAIQTEQGAQRVMLDSQGKKLDTVLSRLPEEPRRR